MLITEQLSAYQESSLVDTYIINIYTRNDVLPTNTLTDIHLSQTGILYAASNEGLIVHDGINWDVINIETNPELLSERILKIFETPHGQVFFQDQSNHLYAININQQIVLLKDPETKQPLEVKAIDVNADWLTVITDNKLLSVDEQFTVRGSEHTIEGTIWDTEMINSIIYVISSKGLYQIEESQSLVLQETFEAVDVNYFTRIEARNQSLLLYGNGGIDCVPLEDTATCEAFKLEWKKDEKVYHLKNTGDNEYVISTNQRLIKKSATQISDLRGEEGLMYESVLDVQSDQMIITSAGVWNAEGLIYQPVVNIVDATTDGNSLWLTSGQHGIIQIKPNKFTHYISRGLVNSYSVIQTKENIWGGSFESGFSKVVKEPQWVSSANSALPNNTIRMMAPLAKGDLFISAWGEKPRIFKNSQIIEIPQFEDIRWATNNVAEGFYEFDNGKVLIGSLDELYLMDDKSVSIVTTSDGSSIEGVQRIVADPFSDKIYLCTQQNGLYVYEENNVYALFDEDEPLHIRDIFFSSPTTFWVASYSDGLIRYTIGENGDIQDRKQVDKANGLPDTGFHKFIYDEDEQLWVSSNHGLIRVRLTDLEVAAQTGEMLKSLKVFTEKDGLINREFNGGSQNTGLIDHSGDLWFTNQSGLVRLNPKDFSIESISRKQFYVRSTSEDNNNEFWLSSDSVMLGGWNSTFRIEFAHINTNQNQTNDIWYSVNDKSWKFSENPGFTAPITLKSGHTFVKFAMYPSKEPFYTLTLIRDTHLLNKLWFKLLLGAVVLFLIAGVLLFKRHLRNTDTKSELVADNPVIVKEKSDVELITECIHRNYHNPGFNLDDLAKEVKMSRSTLYRVWSKEREESLNEFLLSVRLQNAIELLVDEEKTITEAAESSGFRSQSYFSKVFKKYYGISPSKFQEQRKQVKT